MMATREGVNDVCEGRGRVCKVVRMFMKDEKEIQSDGVFSIRNLRLSFLDEVARGHARQGPGVPSQVHVLSRRPRFPTAW